MILVKDIECFLAECFPLSLREAWDNVGLLLGSSNKKIDKIMTTLTVTEEVAQEACSKKINLLISHHPFPFKGLTQITDKTPEGRIAQILIKNDISLYSPHTAFDSAEHGINQMIAEGLQLSDVEHLEAIQGSKLGKGRIGNLSSAKTIEELKESLKKFFKVSSFAFVGKKDKKIRRVAIACGSASSFVPSALAKNSDLLITGEMNMHACLAASQENMSVALVGHYASERFALEELALILQKKFPLIEVEASTKDKDPFEIII